MSTLLQPRVVAKGATGALWLIGSALMIKAELANPQPDPVQIVSVPVVWLIVIALPVLGGYAWRDRSRLASILLWLSAAIGCAYTMSNTIGRQAETRDVRVAEAEARDKRRGEIEKKLAAAEAMLAEAQRRFGVECSSGAGKRCDGVKATLGVYEGATTGHRVALAQLKASEPQAIERRIAAVLALLTGGKPDTILHGVGLFLPALLGLLLEVAALSTAMYGWHHRTVRQPSDLVGQSDFPSVRPDDLDLAARMIRPASDDGDGGVKPPVEPLPREPDGRKARVLAELVTDVGLGRSFPSQGDLCRRYGVARSTMSDWLREWEQAGRIPERRTVGRCKALVKA